MHLSLIKRGMYPCQALLKDESVLAGCGENTEIIVGLDQAALLFPYYFIFLSQSVFEKSFPQIVACILGKAFSDTL